VEVWIVTTVIFACSFIYILYHYCQKRKIDRSELEYYQEKIAKCRTELDNLQTRI